MSGDVLDHSVPAQRKERVHTAADNDDANHDPAEQSLEAFRATEPWRCEAAGLHGDCGFHYAFVCPVRGELTLQIVARSVAMAASLLIPIEDVTHRASIRHECSGGVRLHRLRRRNPSAGTARARR